MVENNRLPDTPWHVGYAKKQENDPRRHKARCIHYRDGQCGWKANYSGKCIGSSHCMEYSESLEDFKKLQESRKTTEQIERDNIDKYKKSLEPKKEQLERSNNPYKYRKCSELNRCLVCDEHLYKEKYEDKLEKVLENPQVLKTPVVRNGKHSTLGYQPDIWKGWN